MALARRPHRPAHRRRTAVTRTKVCAQPGCPELTTTSRCPAHAPKPWANAEQRRPNVPRGRALQARNARILKRDQGICHVCGLPGAGKVDHVTPQAEGGSEDDDNLAAIHATPCHDTKTRAEALRGRTTGG